MKLFAWIALVFGLASVAQAVEPVQSMELPPEVRAWFRNPDGSCVQCSIGMAGVHCNDLRATTLLWKTEYGPAERGGSWPSRVGQYMNTRGIKGWNITGKNTWDWMRWACATGRFAAIGAGRSHFQTLYSYDPNTKTWYVCNNNSTHKVDPYTDAEFQRLHLASGQWCVILEKPSSKPPVLTNWWQN